MSGDLILHFTIGPVQGFIEQARRTRDFWAGSFLLAWLSAVAMKTTEDQAGATILFPNIAGDPMIDALSGRAVAVERRHIGTLPNRFKAEVPAGFQPQVVERAVRGAWQALSDAVQAVFVDPARSLGNDTFGIWERQVGGFWEIAWVIGTADGRDGEWLDRRKNWRSHRPPPEAGDHCTVMGEWQEVSGWTRYRDGERQREFWKAMRDQDRVGDINLVEGERLCAIALVRRLFPLLKQHELPTGLLWETTSNWHSTGHIAAIPWLSEAWGAVPDACGTYFRFVDHLMGPRWARAEQHRPAKRLEAVGDFAQLDANMLFFNDIANPRTVPTVAGGRQMTEQQRGNLRDKRQGLATALESKGVLREPRPYFALLRMDGDGVGKLLGEKDGEIRVGDALQKFIPEVVRLVQQKDGVLIYAGGDDVLALLPTDTALAAATALERAYGESFEAGWPTADRTPTISASIVFADHHEPLRAALHASHLLLEASAKEGNGKDSLAVAVQKPSGSAITWVTAWRDHSGRCVPEALDALAGRLKQAGDISVRLAYTLDRRLLERLGDRFDELGLAPSDIAAIVQEAIGRRRDAAGLPLAADAVIITDLLFVARPHPGPAAATVPPVPFSTDALRLAFFLAGRSEAAR